jgi:hypothetical protein
MEQVDRQRKVTSQADHVSSRSNRHYFRNKNQQNKMKTMKNKNQVRQGDVLIERIENIPTDAKKESGRVILAHGEVTGHAHEIDMKDAEAWKRGGETVAVKVKRRTNVKHQEHAPAPLKRGAHRVIRQREYSPEALRPVAD